MTNRISGLYVILEEDMREDDIEVLINAIKLFKKVASVEKNLANFDTVIAEVRARQDLAKKMFDILYDK